MSKKIILLIHGPNLNLLGKRDAKHYGSFTLKDLGNMVSDEAKQFGFEIKSFQSNHEGDLIDFIQKNSIKAHGVLINAGALTHYSYALHDALIDTYLPCVEVHLSKVGAREKWRGISVIKPACLKVFQGKKQKSYFEALKFLNNIL